MATDVADSKSVITVSRITVKMVMDKPLHSFMRASVTKQLDLIRRCSVAGKMTGGLASHGPSVANAVKIRAGSVAYYR